MALILENNPPQNYIYNLQDTANIFHHPAWHSTISESYGFKLFYIVQREQEFGMHDFVIPIMRIRSNNWVSLPFTDFIKPILNNATTAKDISKSLCQIKKSIGAKTLIIRWPLKTGENVFSVDKFYKHITPLSSDPALIYDRFHRTRVQQCIHKSEKEGVLAKFGTSWQDVKQYYNLHLLNRRRLGVPIQPFRFFKNLWKNLINKGLGFVVLTYLGEQVLSGAIILHWNKTVTYKYSASDSRFWGLRPNNLMLWEAMKWGCEHGYSKFDWGRTDFNNEGLRNFKSNWGSEEEILNYTIYSNSEPSSPRNNKISQILEPIIQHSPLWVCRAIGELFYRFAA